MKILIAIPTYETIYPDTYKSVWEMDRGGHEVQFEFVRGYDIATARNRVAQKAMDLETDWLLMVDNDVVVPKDALTNLLEDAKDVCTGYYAHRTLNGVYDGRMCPCKLYDENGKKYFHYPKESQYSANELHELAAKGEYKVRMHGGGLGCALIRTEVFRKTEYPWFDWVNYADDHRGLLSEDLYFCSKCRKAGIDVYVDTRVGCGHMFRYVQWPKDVRKD